MYNPALHITCIFCITENVGVVNIPFKIYIHVSEIQNIFFFISVKYYIYKLSFHMNIIVTITSCTVNTINNKDIITQGILIGKRIRIFFILEGIS